MLVHELLMHHLAEEHTRVRLSAHSLVDELFKRSHTFKECLVDTFQEYLALAVGVDAEQPLLPLAGAAKILKACTLLAIKHWTEVYRRGYPNDVCMMVSRYTVTSVTLPITALT